MTKLTSFVKQKFKLNPLKIKFIRVNPIDSTYHSDK